MPFVTESLFVTFYVPPDNCPNCNAYNWANTTAVRTTEKQFMWLGRTQCDTCKTCQMWQIDPDTPMEHQAARSKMHDGQEHLIE